MDICEDGHETVVYDDRRSMPCPACVLLREIEQLKARVEELENAE